MGMRRSIQRTNSSIVSHTTPVTPTTCSESKAVKGETMWRCAILVGKRVESSNNLVLTGNGPSTVCHTPAGERST